MYCLFSMLASAQLSGLRALLLNPLELSNYSYEAWPQEVPNILNLSQLPRLQCCNSIMQEWALQCPNMTRKTGYFYFLLIFKTRGENSPQPDPIWGFQPSKDIPCFSCLSLHLQSFFVQINKHVFTTEKASRKSNFCVQ